MTEQEELISLLNNAIIDKGWNNDKLYLDRLAVELKEIDVQNEYGYFLNLVKKKIRYPENEHNLLTPYLLGAVPDFDINKSSAYIYGDYPDIDIDYLPIVRDYIKNVWAPKTFGERYVANIGSYNTFGIKSALQNMARVHGKPHGEIKDITTEIELKDDDGKVLTWDKAIELYPDLKEYCEKYPDVAEAAKKILYRNNSMGKHAGGLIVSSVPIDNFVPLVKGKDGTPVSAWTEGLHGQDLGPVGLVKFDLLVITNLMQIAIACKLVKERHGIKNICALPGQKDWSDTAYLNDPKALEMANKGDLKCIFQFDSQGIRHMAKSGGVTSFNDIQAYAALYRPGPLGMKMDERYIERKRGRESYEIHPLLEPILGETYNVMVYQEQVMQILNVVGDIPLKDCEIIRKAISKKKVDAFKKYQDMFIANGQKTLGWSEKQVENMWRQLEIFSEYGFNRSIEENTLIYCKNGENKLKKIKNFKPGDIVYCVDEFGKIVETEVVALHDHGILDGYEVTFDDGYSITCTLDHKFLTQKGQIPLREIIANGLDVLCNGDSDSADKIKRTKRGLGNQVWGKNQDYKEIVRTSKKLRKMQEFGLEEWKIRWLQSKMRGRISSSKITRRPHEKLSDLSRNQTSKHQEEDGQIERGQQKPREKGYIFLNCSQNICKTRNSTRKSRTSSQMARGKSRKICKLCCKNASICKAFEDGSLVERKIKLGCWAHSVQRRQKTGGFCRTKYMDRSRWSASFFRYVKKMESSFGQSSKTRQNVEQGSHSKKKYHVNSNRHEMFCQLDRSDEIGLVGIVSEHAPISDTRSLVSRKIVRVVSVGKKRMYDLEVANSTHNFCLPNGIITSNSHSAAYSVISSRLLYLKAHYPLEFFTAILSCENEVEKIREYKFEAAKHGVKVMPVDINKSGVKFQIVGNSLDLNKDFIYYGLSSIKGVGEAVSQRIVDNRTYKDFHEFLVKFGTDASVIKPMLGLRIFKEKDPAYLFKYCEWFKTGSRRLNDRKRRLKSRQDQLGAALKTLLPDELADLAVFTEEAHKEIQKKIQNPELLKDVEHLHKQYIRAVDNYNKKEILDPGGGKCAFDPDDFDIDDELVKIFASREESEKKFYGYLWTHPLECSPDYLGHQTLEDYRNDKLSAGPLECRVLKVEEKESKNKKVKYWLLTVEDANSEETFVQVWANDYDRFQNELMEGNLVRLTLKAPDNGFKRYTLYSFPRYKMPTKQNDGRVIVLKRGEN